MSGFTGTVFNSADNTGNNVTVFAPTTIDLSCEDLQLRLASITASADYLLDCCLTLDTSWARAALRWKDSDANDDLCYLTNGNVNIQNGIRDVMKGAMNTATIRTGLNNSYLTTMGNTLEEDFSEHALAWSCHAVLGNGDMRHMVKNAVAFKNDCSATIIGNAFAANLSSNDASDGQVMLETFNQWDLSHNSSARFQDLSELNDIDASYSDNPIPFADNDKIVFKVRIHGQNATRDQQIAATSAPHTGGSSTAIDGNTAPASGAFTTPVGGNATAAGQTSEWLVRITLAPKATANVKENSYTLLGENSSPE